MLLMSRADFSSAKGLLAWRPKPNNIPTAAPAPKSKSVFMCHPTAAPSILGRIHSRLSYNLFQAELSPTLTES